MSHDQQSCRSFGDAYKKLVCLHWCRLALHVMCFSNARAIAGLWQQFVRYLREGCWDQGRLLPRMASSPLPSHQPTGLHASHSTDSDPGRTAGGLPRPDFRCCLLHQKLQMLNICIQKAHNVQVEQAPQPHAAQVTCSVPAHRSSLHESGRYFSVQDHCLGCVV